MRYARHDIVRMWCIIQKVCKQTFRYPDKKPRNKSEVLMRPQGRRLTAAVRILITRSRGNCQAKNEKYFYFILLTSSANWWYFGITEGARETHRSSKGP